MENKMIMLSVLKIDFRMKGRESRFEEVTVDMETIRKIDKIWW